MTTTTAVRVPTICLLAFSHIARDARVLRQVALLAERGRLTVVGFEPFPADFPGVRWLRVEPLRDRSTVAATLALLAAGRVLPAAYTLWARTFPPLRDAFRLLRGERFDLVYANDWNTLPAALELVRRGGGRLVFDAHEFSPLEWEDQLWWRQLYGPFIRRVLRQAAPVCDASLTVSPPIAERLAREFGLRPAVVLNAPARQEAPSALPPRAEGTVRLIHHGGALRARRLELMVEAVALTEPRFTLDFMLVGDDGYIAELQALAEARAPGRVRFVPPVEPRAIPGRIAEYDMGFFVLETKLYNYAMSLPNKLFDYVAAGLPICIGPSPAMAALAEEHGFGWVAPSFDPPAVAAMLNRLTTEDLHRLRENARRASAVLNAEHEMRKLASLLDPLLAAGAPPAGESGAPGV